MSLVTSVNSPNNVLPIKQQNVFYNFHVKRSLCVYFSSYSVGKIHGNKPLEILRRTVQWEIILKCVLKNRMRGSGLNSSSSEQGQEAECCEYGTEHSECGARGGAVG
jgi:hypothetical protein